MIVYVSIPAFVALFFKLVLIAYAARYPVRTLVTRLFLALLVVLAALNFVEVLLLNGYAGYGLVAWVEASGFAYAALLFIAAPVMLHLSIALSFEEPKLLVRQKLIPALYLPIVGLMYLLFFTDRLIVKFEPFMSYSILRVPGPWYVVVETLGVLYFSATLLTLLYGARSSRPALLRIRNRLWLLGMAPMLLFLIYIVIVDYVGGVRLSAPVHLPIAMTFFLLVTTYATHERPRPGGFYRFLQCLFDLESYLPWSRSYKRKTAFYNRLQTMIREFADRPSVKQIVQHLAHTLECPVVLFGWESRPVAMAGETAEMARFPHAELQKIERLAVAHQIARRMPELHVLMTRHDVAAIVPFHPHSRAASWMLLGKKFSDKVYSPFDFQVVETLFDRIAAHFLDEQVVLRSDLAATRPELRALRRRVASAERRLKAMYRKLTAVKEKQRLRKTGEPRAADDVPEIQTRLMQQAAMGKKTLEECVGAIEARLIQQALRRCEGNQAKAAALLGLRPNTLHYKIQRYRLHERDTNG